MEVSKKQVRKAGYVLRDMASHEGHEIGEALDVLSAWRTQHVNHLARLNSFVRGKLNQMGYDKPAIVAQRLKRLPSIIGKLERFKEMSLDRMQDIAGIRVILDSVDDVYAFHKAINNSSAPSRELTNVKDYIDSPKKDGYRSIHCIYKCSSKISAEDGLSVELQIRTKLQHAWSTAVEILGVITRTSIKTGCGTAEQEEYFRLVSCLFAIEEGTPIPESYIGLSDQDIRKKLRDLDRKIQATSSLLMASGAMQRVDFGKDAAYVLVHLDTEKRQVSTRAWDKKHINEAEDVYKDLEIKTKGNPQSNVVLVSVNGMKNLVSAYPNFFLDSKMFINKLLGYYTSGI